MAIVNFTGFETGDAVEIGGLNGTSSIQSSVKRTGTYALRTNPTTTGGGFVLMNGLSATGVNTSFSIADLFVTFYFRYATKPAADNEELFVAATNGVAIRLGSDGILTAYSATPTLVDTGSIVLAADTWYLIEVNVNTTADTIEVKIDGVVDLSASVAGLSNESGIRLGKATNRNGQTVDFFYDDVCISDSAYPGAGECKIGVPIGAGAASGWTNGTGTTFAEVDEIPHDSNTTNISASATQDNLDHTFNMQAAATIGITGAIGAVKTMVVAVTDSASGTSAVAHRRLINAGATELTALELSTSYQLLAVVDIDDTPGAGGSTWGATAFDTIEVGMAANTIAQVQRFTAAYVSVWSAGAPPPADATIASAVDRLTSALTANMQPASTIASAVDRLLSAFTAAQSYPATVGASLSRLQASMTVVQGYPLTIAASIDEVAADLTVEQGGAAEPTCTIASALVRAVSDLTAAQSYPLTIASAIDRPQAEFTVAQIYQVQIASLLDRLSADMAAAQSYPLTIASSIDRLQSSFTTTQIYAVIIAAMLDRPAASLTVGQIQQVTIAVTLMEVAAQLSAQSPYATTIAANLDRLLASILATTDVDLGHLVALLADYVPARRNRADYTPSQRLRADNVPYRRLRGDG